MDDALAAAGEQKMLFPVKANHKTAPFAGLRARSLTACFTSAKTLGSNPHVAEGSIPDVA